jgi:hypothetical protein
VADELKAIAQAVKDERTRIFAALLKVRFALLAKARAKVCMTTPADEAYEDAATMIADFLLVELGQDPDKAT